MRSLTIALGAALAINATHAAAQAAPQAHEHQSATQTQAVEPPTPGTSDEKCCCEEMMKKMMSQMMQKHQGAMSSSTAHPDKADPNAAEHQHNR